MKVKHYNEMMAYLTRPGFNGGGAVSNRTVLPKRKPQAEVKKRKKINYEKIKQYLGKESQELIERELGFAVGGGVNPAQLKQRFMQLVSSIQDAEDAEIPSIVAQAKQIRNQIDDLNRQLAPDRQIKIVAEGLQFDNPLVDAARIKEAVKPVQGIKPVEAIKNITEDNPALEAVPDFPKGDKGTLADPEEKIDPKRRAAVNPKGNIMQASFRIPNRTDIDFQRTKKLYEDVYPEIKTEDEFAEGGRIGFKKGTPFPITDEKLAEIDDLIKNTDLDLKSIGKKIGYGTDKAQLKIDLPIMKAYIKKYGKPKPGRLKPANLANDPEYVRFVIDKVEELGSKKAASKELGITRKTINNVLKQKAPELMKPANKPNPEGKYDYSKVRAKYIAAMEKNLKKMPGGQQTLNQTLALMDKIHAQNKVIATMTDEEILSNKKLIDSMRLDVTELKTSKPRLKFDRYKDFTDEQLVKKIRELAETNQLFQVEHQIPINSKRTASLFPKNIQAAVGRVGGQMESMKKFVINNPNSPVVNDIDKFLKSQNVQIKGIAGQNIGYANNIIFDSKANTSDIVDRGLDIFQKSDGPILGMNRLNPALLDFRKLPDDVKDVSDVIRDLIKTPAGKRIARNLIKAGKFTGYGLAGEVAFAAPFALDDYASGLTGDRILGNVTLGIFGTTEDEEIKRATGELGYATNTIKELENLLPELAKKYESYNDENDPRGEKREQFKNLFNSTADRYNKAYSLFVTDRGEFDKELYNQGVNNYAAGLSQIEKFRAAKEKERGIKGEVTGFEMADPYNPNNIQLDLSFIGGNPLEPKRIDKAGGGIAKEGGVESGVAPESGPTPDGPKGLFSAIKYVKKS